MIIEAFMLVTLSVAYEKGDIVKYSEPMTESSCIELKRNVDAMTIQASRLGYRYTSNTFTRCVPASFISINSVETHTTIENKPLNKILIR